MRRSILLSAMVCLVAAAPAAAQNYPAEAVILLNEVEVRSGPGASFYATSKLKQNDRVIVLREVKDQPGWLEIKPPANSFSWVPGKNVKPIEKTRLAYVDCDPTQPISSFAGSQVVEQKPNRESMKLTTGTALVIVGQPLTINGNETWYPVEPNPSEVRYLPANAVKRTESNTIRPEKWSASPNGYNTNSTLSEAEKALSANDVNRAKQLFQQVASTSTDNSQKQYAINRLASLSVNSQVPATTTSLSPANAGGTLNLQTLKGAEWTTYGRLRDTKLLGDNGQPLYSLEDSTGKAPIYVSTLPGKSLQMYIGRTVAVYGPTMYRADAAVRMPYVVASHVAVP